ncbi:MAG: NAD-dependent epimerase/dehydratase family protein [Solirubrobacterales bacterium]
MKVFLTGGTGFIGGHVAHKLRERGDEVVALVRNPGRAEALREDGCELVEGGLDDTEAIRQGIAGAEAVIHGAAIYAVGIPKRKRAAMYDANVLGTENVLREAVESGTPKVVYVSTVAAFGDTHGEVVDESHEHTPGYTSYYDETKHLSHQLAKRLIEHEGLPCVIVQPGAVYGPDDHSEVGNMIHQFLGHRMPMIPFPDAGFNFVHVDDVADGILRALDDGKPGEAYVLGGQIGTIRDLIETLAEVTDRKAPKRTMPVGLMKASAPLGPVVGPLLGYPPNLKELIATSDGVTWWASHEKAKRELGYAPRDLEQGLRDTLAAEGRLAEPQPTA